MGRVGVVGGSVDYTGAPYYAAAAGLSFGGDLSYVFCEKSAAPALKSYSPELMVTPFYCAELEQQQQTSPSASVIVPFLPRLHALVIGPGLGRNEHAWAILEPVILAAVAANLPLIIDADGLALIEGRLHLIRGYPKCILTPNMVEFGRLCSAALNSLGAEHEGLRADLQADMETHIRLRALCRALDGVTVLVKGPKDMVSDGKFEDVLEIDEPGSPRRCGGQGDLLAGSLGVAAHWAFNRFPDKANDTNESTPPPAMLACVLASVVVRRAAGMAFAEKKRATTTPDILKHIGAAFETVVPCVIE